LDLWVPCSTDILASQYPALFSHVLRPSTSVARVLSSPDLCLDLAPRLTHAAELELGYLRNLLASVSLNLQEPDRRTGRSDGKPLTCNAAYKALWVGEPIDPLAMAIWKNYTPNKCRIFLWLPNKNRLFTNERRFR
uniref:Reverse transcriptase zinc-binding domain-containing protein n=1 Tax=Aegilops tauschii subsp. strangulata TaxID=200361 RepID=A0A453M8Q0_AEGTS